MSSYYLRYLRTMIHRRHFRGYNVLKKHQNTVWALSRARKRILWFMQVTKFWILSNVKMLHKRYNDNFSNRLTLNRRYNDYQTRGFIYKDVEMDICKWSADKSLCFGENSNQSDFISSVGNWSVHYFSFNGRKIS